MAEDIWAQFPDAPKPPPIAQDNSDPWAQFPDAPQTAVTPERSYTQKLGDFAGAEFETIKRELSPEQLARAAIATGRDYVEGAAGIVALPVNAVMSLWNLATGRQDKDFSQVLSQSLDEAGVPRNPNRYASRINQAVAGGGATMGAGQLLAQSGAGVAQEVGKVLASAPLEQTAGAIGGAASSQAAQDAGAGPVGQTVAGLAGGMIASGAVRPATAELVKRSFRGGEEGRQKVADNIALFEETAGRTPSAGQATENRRMQSAESLLSRAPGGAGVMAKESQQLADDVGAGLEQRAATLAPRSSAEQAGRTIQRGISGEGGFVDTFKGKQQELYDKLDEFIPQSQPVDISKTRGALRSLNASIPGAPNVSKFFQNSKIVGIENALEKDLAQPGDAQKALDDALQKIDDLYRSRDYAMQDAGRFQAFAQTQGNKTHDFVPVKGMPRFPGRYSPFPDNQSAGVSAASEAQSIAKSRVSAAQELESSIGDLQKAVEASDGKLPYQAIKQLRTLVGREMAESGLMSDVPRSKWKALYGALSGDLEAAATEAGPQAQSVYTRANNYTRAGMRRLETLDSVIDKSGGPEAVFKAATGGTKEGATTLRAVMQSLPQDGQKMVSATVLRRLGRAKAGVQNDLGEAFSTETFLTNWNSMSPEAKAVLFNRYGPEFRSDMDKVAKLASNLRQGSAVFRNPSGTAQASVQYTTVGAFVMSVLTGNVPAAATIASGVTGANLSARLLTHPPFVKWLAKTTQRPLAAAPVSLNQLAQQAKATKDPVLQEASAALSQIPPPAGRR